MPRRLFLYVAFALILLPPTVALADFFGRVVGVSDGDTIKVMHNGKAEKVRLYGIDCPEKGQAYGSRAKQATSTLSFGKDVTIQVRGYDKYGRTIGEVLLPDGRSLNRELVATGLAWWYRQYAPHYGILERLEAEARTAKRGLWADPHPIPPWSWRKQRK